MEQTVTISVTVPLSKAQPLLDLVRKLETDEVLSAEVPVFSESIPGTLEIGSRTNLAYLLDGPLWKVVSFAVEHKGTFYNKDLAKELRIDTPLTSIYLGHLTKKLRHTGIDSKNWYAKHRTSNGTLLTVREDVLAMFRDAIRK